MVPPDQPVRVAVLDDYEIVVRGVAALLAPYGDRVAVVELDSRMVPRSEIDVLLYDTFGQVQGEALKLDEVLEATKARIVVYSWNLDSAMVTQAIARGASGYVAKSVSGDELATVVQRVHGGEVVTPVGIPDVERVAGDWPGRSLGLTAREAEVLALITQGMSNQEIADQCYLSINSVKTYIRTAYRKMGVTRRSQAVLWGIEHGFKPDRFRQTLG